MGDFHQLAGVRLCKLTAHFIRTAVLEISPGVSDVVQCIEGKQLLGDFIAIAISG
ncbi:hypothetical protein D3C84_1218550 [compost metagenome]